MTAVSIAFKASLASGFQEEWFDSRDVEGFLEEYGVMIDSYFSTPTISQNLTQSGPQLQLSWGTLPPGTILAVDESKLMRCETNSNILWSLLAF
jgi:hypothetical protein